MSHNGIGLQTPRGSGTSGYVQKSLSEKRNEGFRRKRERESEEENRKQAKIRIADARKGAGTEIIAHDRKRWIELKCLELRDELEDNDVDDDETERQIKALREKLANRGNKKDTPDDGDEGTKGKTKTQANGSATHTDDSVTQPKRDNDTAANVSPAKADDRLNKKSPPDTPASKPKSYSYVPRYNDR